MPDPVSYVLNSVRTLVDLGGPVVAIQLVISVIGLAMVFYKIIQFAPLRQASFDAIGKAIDLWNGGDPGQAGKLLDRSWSKLAPHVKFGLARRGDSDRELLRDELARRGMNFLRPYGSLLRALELVYYLSPVLGLLGTVLGMIDAFRQLAAVAGSEQGSSALANGIWEALVCTAVGLVIAIIFTALHAMLQTRLERVSEETSDLLTRVLTSEVADG